MGAPSPRQGEALPSDPYQLPPLLPANLYQAVVSALVPLLVTCEGDLWLEGWGWAQDHPDIGKQTFNKLSLSESGCLSVLGLLIYSNPQRAGSFTEQKKTTSEEEKRKNELLPLFPTLPPCHLQARSRIETLCSPSNPKT